MNLLAIETSTETATVAVKKDGAVFSAENRVLRQHAQSLLPMIDELLSKAELSLAMLDGVVFGQGPGSFTGLRVACSMAKALAFSQNLPLFPVSSLGAIAFQAQKNLPSKHDIGQILAVIDARMGQLYWSTFSAQTTLKMNEKEYVSNPEDLSLANEDQVVLAGVGFESYLSNLPEKIRERIVLTDVVYPNAIAMIEWVELGGIEPTTPALALPSYIRNQVTQGASRG